MTTIDPQATSADATTADAATAGADAAPLTSDALPTILVDAVVIGGGAAGLSGALMLARSCRSVVVIDSGTPRNAPAEGIHALLGNEGTPPAEYLARGRAEVRQYGGLVVTGEIAAARASEPSADGDLRFTLTLADGRTLTARRLLIASGIRDRLPDIPGLAAHWGTSLVHCPFCHGWEVRDQAIGVIATRAMSFHQVLMFRALSEDITVFVAEGLEVDEETRERFAALGVTVVAGGIQEIVADAEGGLLGVRLADGELVPRAVLTTATEMLPRLDGLEDLGLQLEEMPAGMGAKIATGNAGATEVPGVWVAGNAADPAAQVGAAAAGGALAGAHLHGMLVMADAEAAVAAHRARAAA